MKKLLFILLFPLSVYAQPEFKNTYKVISFGMSLTEGDTLGEFVDLRVDFKITLDSIITIYDHDTCTYRVDSVLYLREGDRSYMLKDKKGIACVLVFFDDPIHGEYGEKYYWIAIFYKNVAYRYLLEGYLKEREQ